MSQRWLKGHQYSGEIILFKQIENMAISVLSFDEKEKDHLMSSIIAWGPKHAQEVENCLGITEDFNLPTRVYPQCMAFSNKHRRLVAEHWKQKMHRGGKKGSFSNFTPSLIRISMFLLLSPRLQLCTKCPRLGQSSVKEHTKMNN